MFRRFGFIALLFASSAHAQPRLPPGYSLGPHTALPDSLQEVRVAGRFRIVVQRFARDSAERRMLEYAERLIPPRTEIEQAASKWTGGGWVKAFAAAAKMPGERWWWREWDGVLLPYELTGAAVQSYIDQVRALSEQRNAFDTTAAQTASVAYTASVARDPESGVAFRVRLAVRWSYYCGKLCALSFEHERTVDVDRDGNVIRITGDSPPAYVVSTHTQMTSERQAAYFARRR